MGSLTLFVSWREIMVSLAFFVSWSAWSWAVACSSSHQTAEAHHSNPSTRNGCFTVIVLCQLVRMVKLIIEPLMHTTLSLQLALQLRCYSWSSPIVFVLRQLEGLIIFTIKPLIHTTLSPQLALQFRNYWCSVIVFVFCLLFAETRLLKIHSISAKQKVIVLSLTLILLSRTHCHCTLEMLQLSTCSSLL